MCDRLVVAFMNPGNEGQKMQAHGESTPISLNHMSLSAEKKGDEVMFTITVPIG